MEFLTTPRGMIVAVLGTAYIAMSVWKLILRRRLGRAYLTVLRDYAAREGFKIISARQIVRGQIPAVLKEDPRVASGVYVMRFRAIEANGKDRTGFIRFPFPMTGGRFEAPILVHWPSTGPSFDDLP